MTEFILWIVAGLAVIAAPLLLLLLLRRSLRSARGHRSCGACGYDVEANLGQTVRCPECGGVLAVVGLVQPHRKRAHLLVMTILLLGVTLLVTILMLSGFAAYTAQSRRVAAEAAQAAAAQTAQIRAEAAMLAARQASSIEERTPSDDSAAVAPPSDMPN